MSLTVLTFVYLVGSIRTNFCLFSALLLLVITFALFAGSYFSLAAEQLHLAAKLQLVSARHIPYPISPTLSMWIQANIIRVWRGLGRRRVQLCSEYTCMVDLHHADSRSC